MAQQLFARLIGLAPLLDFLRAQQVVWLALALCLRVRRRHHACAHSGARFARGCAGEFGLIQGRHVDLQVDAVEQRPGNPGAITRHLIGVAAAFARCVAQIAAGAGVHRGHQLKARREIRLTRRARNRHAARLQRLAQHFEYAAVKLGQLVEEQHTVMRERNLAGARHCAAAHECHARCRVMRCAHHTPAPGVRTKRAGETQYRCRLQCFAVGHRRQDAGQTCGEHRFASAGRPHHQNRMTACGGHFECAFGLCLALHVGEIFVGCLGVRYVGALIAGQARAELSGAHVRITVL